MAQPLGVQIMGESLGLMNMEPKAFHEEVKQKRLSEMGSSIEGIEEIIRRRAVAGCRRAAGSIRDELEEKQSS